ncbi:MAG: hypothetical protein ACE5QF_03280 [Thermoplasmata archaeon]
MNLPRIVRESKRAHEERPPPPTERTRPHYWLGEDRRKEIESLLVGGGVLPLYISKTAEAKMRNHSISCGERNQEAMGLLLGDVYVHSNETYSIVEDVVTTRLKASRVSVSFERDGLEQLFGHLDDVHFDYVIIGWYHSHPGYTCFMSPKDVETQRAMFREKFHFAIVLDPTEMQIEAYTLSGDNCVPAPFLVYWDEFEDPYGRMKRLAVRPR